LRRVQLLLGTSPTTSGLFLCLLKLGEEKGVGVTSRSSSGSLLLLGLKLLTGPTLVLLGEEKLELKLRHGIGGLLGRTGRTGGQHGLKLFGRELTSGGAGVGILVGGVHASFFVRTQMTCVRVDWPD
jgi:hypothetical protein